MKSRLLILVLIALTAILFPLTAEKKSTSPEMIKVAVPPIDLMNSSLPKDWFGWGYDDEIQNLQFVNGVYTSSTGGMINGQITLVVHDLSKITKNSNDYLILYDAVMGANGAYPGILYVHVDDEQNPQLIQKIDAGPFGSKLINSEIITYYPDSPNGQFSSYADMRSSVSKEVKYFKFLEKEKEFIHFKTEIVNE